MCQTIKNKKPTNRPKHERTRDIFLRLKSSNRASTRLTDRNINFFIYVLTNGNYKRQ